MRTLITLLRIATAAALLIFLASSQAMPSLAGRAARQSEQQQIAAGNLDPTFGTAGKVVTDFFGSNDAAAAIAIQPDGKIVAGGSSFSGGANPHLSFALSRYNTDGGLDHGFGSNGRVTTDFFTVYNTIYGIAIQPDGKIVAAGAASHPGSSQTDFALARYNPDGSLDRGFGTGGLVTTNFFGHNDAAFTLCLAPGGKIVVAGHARPQASNNAPMFALARYNPDGSLDSTFGTSGKVTTAVGNLNEGASAVAVQPDNKTVVAGLAVLKQGGPYVLVLLRFTSDGRLDPSFGIGGTVTNAISDGPCGAYGMALQRDGKIVVAGYAQQSPADVDSQDFALARYNQDGSPDSSFNGLGMLASNSQSVPLSQVLPLGTATTDFFGHLDNANAVVIQDDGKIVVAGSSQSSSDFDSCKFAVARYMPNGALDPTFATNGKTVTDYAGHLAFASAVALQQDGMIVVGGSAQSTTDFKSSDFALARYTVEPDFALAVDQPVVDAMAGTKVSVEVLINRKGGFGGSVTVTAPDTSGIKVKIKPPNPIATSGGQVKYKLKIKGAAPTGPHQLVFSAKDDSARTRTATLTLNIQ